MRGAPTIFQGEELGLLNGEVAPEDMIDPQGKGGGVNRDLCRTPFHWNDGPNAGFSTGKPWLPVASTYRTLNVEAEDADPRSMLTLYRRLLALRRAHPALHAGSLTLLDSPPDVLAFLREDGGERFVTALNFSAVPQVVALPQWGEGVVVLSTALDRQGGCDLAALELRPNEGVLVRLA